MLSSSLSSLSVASTCPFIGGGKGKMKGVSLYTMNQIAKNKVRMLKFTNTISLLDRKIARLDLSSEILEKVSQKLLEKNNKLYSSFKWLEELYIKSKTNQKGKRNHANNEEPLDFAASDKMAKIMDKLQNELHANQSIIYRENDRISIEHKKKQAKFYAKVHKKTRIHKKQVFAVEMNELQEFIYATKCGMKSNSVINLDRLSLLPAELILIIREYLPISVRTQVLENTWNIPRIEFANRYNNNYYTTDETDTMTNLIKILSQCDGYNDGVFCNHPLLLVIYKNYIKYSKYNTKNNSLLEYTIMFDALILLIKSSHPALAYKVLTLIKQDKLTENKHAIIDNTLDILFPENDLYSMNNTYNKFSDWY
jgi:hypothetical protein